MRMLTALRGAVLAVVASGLLLGMMTSGASATGLALCVPSKPNAPTRTPLASGGCQAGYTMTQLGGESRVAVPAKKVKQPELTIEELALLKAILPYVKYAATGVGGKPTIQVSGANLQIVNGQRKPETTNGAGNLIIGNDEEPGEQTGSGNLVLGKRQTYTSYGSILGGQENMAESRYTVVFGERNRIEGLGGFPSATASEGSSISGGIYNTIQLCQGTNGSSATASISGGYNNSVETQGGWIGGGADNQVECSETNSGGHASISGGQDNLTFNELASISGGYGNHAQGRGSSILGGQEQTITEEYGMFP